MQGQSVRIVSQAIRYMEDHLNEKLNLDMVAAALHYSKFHLHRIFTEIALISGFESQQAFTDIFKAMYKTTPAQFRKAENFYPLQLTIHLTAEPVKSGLTKEEIQAAAFTDMDDWMELVALTIDGYPCLDQDDCTAKLHQYIADKRALILRDLPAANSDKRSILIGAAAFSGDTGSLPISPLIIFLLFYCIWGSGAPLSAQVLGI